MLRPNARSWQMPAIRSSMGVPNSFATSAVSSIVKAEGIDIEWYHAREELLLGGDIGIVESRM